MYVARRRRGINRGCILFLLSVLLICTVPRYFIYRAIASSIIADVVTLQPPPLVAIESCSTVKVTSNNTSDTVTIRGDRFDREIDRNALYIKGRACLEIDVEVPVNTDLRVIATTDVEVTGITGELQLIPIRVL